MDENEGLFKVNLSSDARGLQRRCSSASLLLSMRVTARRDFRDFYSDSGAMKKRQGSIRDVCQD